MAAEATLQRRVVTGLSWKAAAQVTRQLTRVVLIVVLARELSPAEYGLAGMVLVFSTLVMVFADLGLGAALVQRPGIDELDRSTVFWTAAAAGLAFTLGGFALAAPVAAFFGEPEVAPLFRGLSVAFLITAIGSTHVALFTRELDFRRLALRQMAAAIIGACGGIALALAGAGAWAIIGQQLVVATTSTVLVWSLASWRPRLRFSLRRLRTLGRFGANVFGTRLMFYVERNSDNLLVGKVLGSSALGVYGLAYTIMLVPLEQIGGPIAEVLFPALARIQDDLKRLRAAWLRAVRLLAAVVAPLMLGLIALAPDLVHVVLGPRWSAVTPVIQILAWVGLHQSLQRFNSSVLQATDHTRDLRRYSLLSLVCNVPAFAIGLQWGVVGVAGAYAVSSTLVAPVYLVLTTRACGLRVREFLGAIVGVVAAALLAAAFAWIARELLLDVVGAPAVRVAVIAPAAALLYVLACRRLAPDVGAELRRLAGPRLRSQRSNAPASTRPEGLALRSKSIAGKSA